MDHDNLEYLDRIQPPNTKARVMLMLAFATKTPTEDVPDPYYGGKDGFEKVLDMLEDASRGLLTELRQR